MTQPEIKEYHLSDYPKADEQLYIHRLEGHFAAQEYHRHDYFQIYYVLKGSFEHHILGGKIQKMFIGDMFIIPPGLCHHIASQSSDARYYSLSFKKEFLSLDTLGKTELDVFLSFLSFYSSDDQRRIHPKLTIPIEEQQKVGDWIQHIYDEFYTKADGYCTVIQGLIISLLAIFTRFYNTKQENFTRLMGFENNRAGIISAVKHIEEHFTEEIFLDVLAKQFSMSRTNFHTYFKMFTGVSCHQYICRLRIEYALKLMKSSELDTTRIAYICGFGDYSSFYRNFKSIAGISPQEYRLQRKKQLPT